MGVDIEQRDDVVILRPQGPNLDLTNHQELSEAFRAALPLEPKRVILDMQRVVYIDSVGLGSLLGGRRHLRGKVEVHLCGLTEAVEAAIRSARLDLIFPVHSTVHSALQAVK